MRLVGFERIFHGPPRTTRWEWINPDHVVSLHAGDGFRTDDGILQRTTTILLSSGSIVVAGAPGVIARDLEGVEE